MNIKIETEHGSLEAELSKDRNPKTAEAIIQALPITGHVSRWGDEIYFEIPARADEEDSQKDVEVGDIAYWPQGRALCIFFGRTPVSTDNKPRAYSPVNVIGKVVGNLNVLKQVEDGETVKVRKT